MRARVYFSSLLAASIFMQGTAVAQPPPLPEGVTCNDGPAFPDLVVRQEIPSVVQQIYRADGSSFHVRIEGFFVAPNIAQLMAPGSGFAGDRVTAAVWAEARVRTVHWNGGDRPLNDFWESNKDETQELVEITASVLHTTLLEQGLDRFGSDCRTMGWSAQPGGGNAFLCHNVTPCPDRKGINLRGETTPFSNTADGSQPVDVTMFTKNPVPSVGNGGQGEAHRCRDSNIRPAPTWNLSAAFAREGFRVRCSKFNDPSVPNVP